MNALILFAHGARDPDWANPIHGVRATMRDLAPEQRVELAFLEFMEPSLESCANQLVADGCQRVTVVPMFIAQGGHLKRDVPVLLEALRQQHPGCEFVLTPPVGESAKVIAAMAQYALGQ